MAHANLKMTTSVSTPTILFKPVTRISPILAATLLLIIPNILTGFVIPSISYAQVSRNRIPSVYWPTLYRMSKDDDSIENVENLNSDDEEDDDDFDLEPVFAADVRGRPAGVVLEDLDWRVEKLRLEEANKRRFLKSGPRFLPYEEAKKWVQAWGERWISEKEWYVEYNAVSA